MTGIHKLSPRFPPCNKVKAVILDYSGTIIDPFVIAPAEAFVLAFKKHGINLKMEEVREPMGLRKDLHIAKILASPNISKRWLDINKRGHTDEDVKNIFKDFVPIQLKCLEKYSGLLPGVKDVIDELRSKYDLKIGLTTGFISEMGDFIHDRIREQGVTLDASVAGDQVNYERGYRPAPFMIFENLLQMGVFPMKSVVKVDDTVSGVAEGLNAGCWTVGVYGFSNYMNISSMYEYNIMSQEEKNSRLQVSRNMLLKSGAHYVIETLDQLPWVISDINSRLTLGSHPYSEV